MRELTSIELKAVSGGVAVRRRRRPRRKVLRKKLHKKICHRRRKVGMAQALEA